LRLTDSGLERRWIHLVDRLGLRLPSTSQKNVDDCYVRPDFLYEDEGVAIFVDGPPHDTPEQQAKDAEQRECLEDLGYHVLRFHHQGDWEEILRCNPSIFGTPVQNTGIGEGPSLRNL
jgi:very-short-patch-repair endonuclease